MFEEIPTVPCEVFVQGTRDPEDRYTPQYFVQLVPTDLTFPEDYFIGRNFMDTKQLQEYLEGNEDYWDEAEVFGREDEEWRDEMLSKLPSPFKREAYVKLAWQHPENTSFDGSAKLLWKMYHSEYSLKDLEHKTVDELKIITHVKGVSSGGNKAEIIQAILEAQNSEKEVRVSFRRMFSEQDLLQPKVGDTVETTFDTKGKVVKVKETPHLNGVVARREDRRNKTVSRNSHKIHTEEKAKSKMPKRTVQKTLF